MNKPPLATSMAAAPDLKSAQDSAIVASRSLPVSVIVSLLLLVDTLTAFCRSFSSGNLFSYDDEGTLMTIVQQFISGHSLYDQVVVYYGPFYYFYEWCAHALTGASVSHDSVRLVSICFWVTSAMLVFFFLYHATHSLLLAAGTHFLAFQALGFLGFEPAHPQELCITLLAAFMLASCAIRNRTALMLSLGALAGGMAATKINLGVFAVVAMTLALIAAMRRGRPRSCSRSC